MDDCSDRSSAHSVRKDEESISPPTYRVVENELGDLFNPDLKVKYPERPKKGRYSLSSYLRSRKKIRRNKKKVCADESVRSDVDDSSKNGNESRSKLWSRGQCRCKCGRCCCRRPRHRRERSRYTKSKNYSKITPAISLDALIRHERRKDINRKAQDDNSERNSLESSKKNSKASTLTDVSLSNLSLNEQGFQNYKHSRMSIAESLRKTVIGPQTAATVGEMLAPTQFLLYYRRADPVYSIDDVPLSEPLMMAYKTSENKVHHYNVCHTSYNGRKVWRIDLGPGTKKQREFYSLNRLIQYYKEFRTLSGDAL